MAFWVDSVLPNSPVESSLIRVRQAARKASTGARRTLILFHLYFFNYAIYSSALQRSRAELNCSDLSTRKLCTNLSAHTRVYCGACSAAEKIYTHINTHSQGSRLPNEHTPQLVQELWHSVVQDYMLLQNKPEFSVL